jgi:hypothetical protein
MKTIHLTDDELAMVRNAVHGYLTTFGHEEHEVVEQAKSTLAKLEAAADESEEPSELIG